MTREHSFRVATAGYIFQGLRIGATLWDGQKWWPIHLLHSVHAFELEHAVEVERAPYNQRCLKKLERSGRIVQAQHAGFFDLFVPIKSDSAKPMALVVGPFLTERPSASDVLERFRWLTRRRGNLADAEFAHYLSVSLGTLVLEPKALSVFKRLLLDLAELMAGRGEARALEQNIEALRSELLQARFAERMWEASQSMIDERSARSWSSPDRQDELELLGLRRAADQVLVGLIPGGDGGDGTRDPVARAVKLEAFQRRSVEFARDAGNVIAGRVGDHGLVFLCAFSGSAQHRARKLELWSQRLAALSRREFGFSLHFGSGVTQASEPLSRVYQRALGAAELALSQGRSLVSSAGPTPSPRRLRELRGELGQTLEQKPRGFLAAFDRYVEAAILISGYRTDVCRAELESGLERAGATLLRLGVLDDKSFSELGAKLDRAAAEASSVGDLAIAYRSAAAELGSALEKPTTTRQERSLSRALDYVRQNAAGPLSLGTVARVAGFAPKYFSVLFRKREGMTLEMYVRALRVERAKRLLSTTKLTLSRVAELSGFSSAQYFCRVFKLEAGTTPAAFRLRRRGSRLTSVQ